MEYKFRNIKFRSYPLGFERDMTLLVLIPIHP